MKTSLSYSSSCFANGSHRQMLQCAFLTFVLNTLCTSRRNVAHVDSALIEYIPERCLTKQQKYKEKQQTMFIQQTYQTLRSIQCETAHLSPGGLEEEKTMQTQSMHPNESGDRGKCVNASAAPHEKIPDTIYLHLEAAATIRLSRHGNIIDIYVQNIYMI